MQISELPISEGIKQILHAQNIKELYLPQEQSINFALQGKNLILAVPTASGKSLVAYLSILQNVLNGGKALYIVPLRALASEKYDDLKEFEKLGIKVVLSYGDLDSEDEYLEKFDIIVATSEKADSLLRHRTHWLSKITVVVADEIHLINDAERGPTLEVILSRFLQQKCQIIGLSATIQNSDELANWLNAVHVKSNWRPVLLKEGVFCNDFIYFKDKEKKEIIRQKDEIVSLIVDALKENSQSLIFVNTRKSTESLAKKLSYELKNKLSEEEKKELENIANFLIENSEERAISSDLANCLKFGVAYHHAGLTNEQRKIVEKNFKERKLKIIVATPTLAAGINLPARKVIVRECKRYDSNYGYTSIPNLEIKQMMGRAGRPKYDKEGEAVLIAKTENEMQELFENYIFAETEKIYSKLAMENSLRMHILSSIATNYVKNREDLRKFIQSTFFAFQNKYSEIEKTIEEVIRFLRENEFLQDVEKYEFVSAYDYSKEELTATEFGKRTSELYIDPLSAVILRDCLKNSEGKNLTVISILHSICSTPDMQKLYLGKGDYEKIEGYFEEHKEEFLKLPIEDDYEWFLAELKTAMVLEEWIEEKSEDEIFNKFGVYPGDLRTKVEVAEWLLYAMKELASIYNKRQIKILYELILRVHHGIKKELIGLIELKGVGRRRARILYNSGYKNKMDLKRADINELKKLPLIGEEMARKIMEQL